MNLARELRNANKYDLISFDIFDTLIERKVKSPTDIFMYVGEKYFKNHNDAIDFYKKRIIAEHSARKRTISGEVNIDDIYIVLDYDGKVVNDLKEMEINTEIELCVPRSPVVNLFNELKKQGKRVVLISDMYLTKECILKMLEKCGIEGFDEVFISNVYDCDKVSGKLYRVVHERYGVQGKSHLHYGDSIKADVLGARKAGVSFRLVLKRNFGKRLIRKVYERIRGQR